MRHLSCCCRGRFVDWYYPWNCHSSRSTQFYQPIRTEPVDEIDLNEVLTYAPEAICYSHIPLMTDYDGSVSGLHRSFYAAKGRTVLPARYRQCSNREQQQTKAANGAGTSNVLPPMPKVDMVITNAGAMRCLLKISCRSMSTKLVVALVSSDRFRLI